MAICFMQNDQCNIALQSFLDYLALEKRFSSHTVTAYRTDLEQFFIFLQQEFEVSNLAGMNASLVRSWLAGLMDQRFSATSVKRKISTLKAFFKYQVRTGVLLSSPMVSVVAPKAGKKLPQYVQPKETETLFQHVEFTEGFEGATERLVLSLFYNTGIRLSELIHIRETDIAAGSGNLKVLGKGNKERLVPLSQQLLDEIAGYLQLKGQASGAWDNEYLLVTPKGKKMYPKYVYLIVKKYLSLVTTINKRSPHILRHTFATHLTNEGADLNAVKELLGHASLASTQVYTHNNIEKLKKAYRKAHPNA